MILTVRILVVKGHQSPQIPNRFRILASSFRASNGVLDARDILIDQLLDARGPELRI